MSKLNGKVAVITGGTSGMALATAGLFVREGAHVFVTGRRKDRLDEAVAAIGRNVTGVRGDVADLDDLDRLVEAVAAEKGRVDVLFANAGVSVHGEPLGTVTEHSFDSVFDVNVRGTLFTAQKLLPLMADGASIILTGSATAVKGFPGSLVYSASKAALRSFARTWTADLKDRRIRVNLLSPGPIDTPATEGVPPEFRERLIGMLPSGRFGADTEVATAALFLASGDSAFVTGTELFVDGGMAQV
ncbi:MULTISPECIES: SDR family oxidoreductase [Thermomonosporaceae]|uniref:SDR family oxidoreductase n=1 Tax=Thermomonosporaceae TaxID=2012 RepID=UPI00255AB406|nr:MULTISPECIES: SDR family oxidoreductase [Thermomonosporaceae]MDL4777339.1 SDR family oxidoreductase [Actinomadura xylanilytica]